MRSAEHLPAGNMTIPRKTPKSRKKIVKHQAPSKSQAKKIIEEGAKRVTEDDIKKVHEKADEIKKHFSEGSQLSKYIEEAKLLLGIVNDYWNGSYREIPFFSLAAIVVTLLYVLNPFDLIPDFIPVIGQIDDMAVFGVCLLLITHDLHEYKVWKEAQIKKKK
jgi:uncharacterized membrane protein YkvA (DUF1232 family)